MIKIYCEDGSLTRDVRKLKSDKVELITFPFENRNKRTRQSKKPSELLISNMFIRASSDIRIGDTDRSELFNQIESIVGKKNYNDIRHIDTAYKEQCHIFISPDKKDIVSKGEDLHKLTGIKFFHCDDIASIQKYISKLT